MNEELIYLYKLIDEYYNPPKLKYYLGTILEKKSLLKLVENITNKETLLDILKNEYGLIGTLIYKYKNDKMIFSIKDYIENIELNK